MLSGMIHPLPISEPRAPEARRPSRYLTTDQKAGLLGEWETAKAQRLRPADDAGGHGWVDPEVVPICDALNDLPGVCSLQSCAGHGESPGHLWLWLDEHNSRAIDVWGHVLARLPGIEAVSRKYTDWGQQITAIEFDSRLEIACESVLCFFVALETTSGSFSHDPLPDTHYPARL